jgi:alpha-tubulin suppressor-like RCC1 family protein
MSQPATWKAGFNAFHQLSSQAGDIWEFEPLTPELTSINNEELELFYTGWSSTAFKSGPEVHSLGFQSFTTETPIPPEGITELRCPFGSDQQGLIGCLNTQGRVLLLHASESSEKTILTPTGDSEAPPISHLAIAGNERVAITFKQAPNARLTHIAEFTSFENFKEWHMDPSSAENYPAEHHMLPGRPKQLLANGANFILLMEDGEVYTWGDPRFRTLARPIAGPDAVTADKPGVVEALGGLKIASIQCGPGVGWLASALSEDGALYLWGTPTPGEDGIIRCLNEVGPGEVALVEITSETDAEPVDIVSAGVGRNHVAVVTEAGHLFVVGDNGNGQLGLGKDLSFVEDWTRVSRLHGLKSVVAGPKATFAFAQ